MQRQRISGQDSASQREGGARVCSPPLRLEIHMEKKKCKRMGGLDGGISVVTPISDERGFACLARTQRAGTKS